MQTRIKKQGIPISVYILTLCATVLTFSSYQVAGMMPDMAIDLGVSIAQIGYLVSIHSFAQAMGGILLIFVLQRIKLKNALLILLGFFMCGEAIGAISGSYAGLVVGRIITGAANGAFWGISVTMAVQLVSTELRGRAMAIVLTGISFGTVIGLPAASVVGDLWGWQVQFGTVVALAATAAGLSIYLIPTVGKSNQDSLIKQLSAFKNAKLWLIYLTSMLVIGASFAGFSFFKPILQDITGLSNFSISALLFAYGIATIIGMNIVGYFALKYSLTVISMGIILLILFFSLFAIFPTRVSIVIIVVIGTGLVGVTMNPALAARVVKTAGNQTLVNTMNYTAICSGIMIGSALAGFTINMGWGLTSALWVGIAMAILALLSLVPELWLRPEKS